MANEKVQTKIPMTIISDGQRISPRKGELLDIPEEAAEALIDAGYVEEYSLVEPTGKLAITGTAEVDVAAYATAQVVDENLIAGNIKKDVTILGVTGTLE